MNRIVKDENGKSCHCQQCCWEAYLQGDWGKEEEDQSEGVIGLSKGYVGKNHGDTTREERRKGL